MDNQDLQAVWDRGSFTIVPIGAMCGPATFRLEDGRDIQPFYVAPWADEEQHGHDVEALPPLLRRLRGEWACVPFGMPSTRGDLPADWTPQQPDDARLGQFFHGPCANLQYELAAQRPGHLDFVLRYPPSHPIASVRRSIRGVPGRARLEFGLEIEARQAVELPLGVHPTFRLPTKPGAAELAIGGDIRVHTYPADAEPGVSRLAHGQTFASLAEALTADQQPVDLSRHPLPYRTEEIVLVSQTDGRASLTNHEERYRVDLTWDPAAFPSCNLWISNGGRSAYPWSGRNIALGIEPVVAPFDLGTNVATTQTPLRRAEVRTAATLRPDTPWSTSYSIEVTAL